MKKVGRDYFLIDKSSQAWDNIEALRCVPGVKPRFFGKELIELRIHRSHLPLLGDLGRDYSHPVSAEGPFFSPYELRDYQKEAISFAQPRSAVLFAHDLGLGKSAMALGSVELPAVIVCPTSALYVWGKECEAHGFDYQILQGLDASADKISYEAKIWITTYGSLQAWLPFFRKSSIGPSFLGMIVDEAHGLHLRAGRPTKMIRSIAKEQFIILTATPTRNRLVSLHGLLDALAPGCWGSLYEYRRRYCEATDGEYGLEDGKLTHIDEFRDRLREVACWESWTSPRVAHLRPELITDTIPLKMDHGDLYDMTRAALARAYQDKVYTSSPLPYQTAQKVLAGQAKAAWLTKSRDGLDVLEGLLASHDRIVFWCWHKSVANSLHDVLIHLQPACDLVTGDDLTRKRARVLEEWQKGSGARVLVATMGALSTAVNLTTAQAAVFTELSWAPIDIQQAEARHHRPGNENEKVYSYYLTVPGTIEDRIAEVLIEKLEHHEEVFGCSSQHDQILSLKEPK